MSWWHSRRIRYLLSVLGLAFGLFVSLRLLFWLLFHSGAPEFSAADLRRAVWIGVRFDFRLAALVTLPVLVLAVLPRWNLVRSRSAGLVAQIYVWLALGAGLAIYIFDFGHYDYLEERLNAAILRFLQDFAITTRMLTESYPVVPVLILGPGTWLALLWILARARRLLERPPRPIPAYQRLLAPVLLFSCCLMTAFGQLSLMPLRWSEAFFSSNRFITAMGLNPVFTLADSFKGRSETFDIEAVRRYYPEVSQYLGVTEPDAATLRLDREAAGAGSPSPPVNLILILLETLPANRLGILGHDLDPTPQLDRIAADSLLFPYFYVPVYGTSRSVFGMVTGIPDVTAVETASRNPLITDQPSILRDFIGAETYYLIGGSAGWANIKGFMQRSLPGLELLDRASFPDRPTMDTWGISDLDLFREAHEIFDRRDRERPFVAFIQTAANHKPYTIPEDNAGFVPSDLDEATLRSHGFRSLEEFNALRFLDHSIGEFFRLAEGSDYLENTLVAFFGDHGSWQLGTAPNLRPADRVLNLTSHHCPLIIYGPDLIGNPRRIETPANLMDILPTLAGLAGIPYRNTTLGVDLLDPRFATGRYAFTSSGNPGNPRIGVLDRDFYLQVDADGSDSVLYTLAAERWDKNVAPEHPEKASSMERLARGLYETSRYLLFRNVAEIAGGAS